MPPRPIRPKNDAAALEGSDAAMDTKSAKRKAVSSACIPCRKRKSKCDGQTPSCSTCIAVYRTECSYDADSDHGRKGALKRSIQTLQSRNDALDVIVASLKSLPEDDAIALLHNLRNDGHTDLIANTLRSNVQLPHKFAQQTLEADIEQHRLSPTPSMRTSTPMAASFSPISSGAETESWMSSAAPGSGTSTSWFRVPQDADFIQHLLELYWCWIHPWYHLTPRDPFLHDFERGQTDYCSALLVNAIASFACHYSDRPAARTDPNAPSTAGDHFFAEAKHLLDKSDRPCLTTVQALGIMAIREASAGRESHCYRLTGRCVRMALEMGLHLTSLTSMKGETRPGELETKKIIFWAVFNLETRCAFGFGRLSQLPRAGTDIPLPLINIRNDSIPWRPYQDTNFSLSPIAEQPARTILFQQQLSKLSELASEMVNTFYAPQERFTSKRVISTYARYQQWFRDLPECFRLENTSLPYVLVLHMYYYACVLHLFRPYIKLDLSGINLYPRETCTFCANEISSLMNALRAMYGLRRIVLVVSSLLMSASTIHLLNLPSESAAAHLSQALHDLEAVSVNHPFAAQAIDIIRSLSSKWKIPLPESAASVAVYRMPGQRGVSASPRTTFFAASINPNTERTRSGASSGSSTGSPFGPPGSQPTPQMQQQHHTSTPTFYSDPTTSFDPGQEQMAFWNPFPAQGMPMPQLEYMAGAMGPPQMDGQVWTPMPHGGIPGPSAEHQMRQNSAPARMDESMDQDHSWTWQS